MKFRHFFLFLWVLVALLDPNPAGQNQCGSGSIALFYCFIDPVCLLQVVAAFLAGCTEAVLTPLERIQTLLLGQNRYKPLTATSRRVMDPCRQCVGSGSGLGPLDLTGPVDPDPDWKSGPRQAKKVPEKIRVADPDTHYFLKLYPDPH
jgi:hypothetical protein